MIDPNAVAAQAALAGPVDPTTGLPAATAATAEPADINTVSINIDPPLSDIRLADVIEAIVKVADKPIKYSIEDYGVVFSLRGPELEPLHTRTFKLHPNSLYKALERVSGFSFAEYQNYRGGGGQGAGTGTIPRVTVSGSSAGGDGRSGEVTANQGGGLSFITRTNSMQLVSVAVATFFSSLGVDLASPNAIAQGKSIFWGYRKGLLLVRATKQDLDVIERALADLAAKPTSETNTIAPPTTVESGKSASGDNKAQGVGAASPTSGPIGNALPKSLYENTPGPRYGVSLYYQVEVREDGSYWASGRRMDLSELRAWLLKTRQPEADASIGFQIHSNAPPGAVRALTELRSELGTPAGSVIPAPPHINIKVKFVEMPEQAAETFWLELLLTNRTGTTNLSVTMAPGQTARVLKNLSAQDGGNILSSPEVTTLSSRRAQVQVVDLRTIVTGDVNPEALAPPGVTSTNVFRLQQMPFGTTFDVVPVQSVDGDAIHLTITANVTEFLGYDEPNWTNSVIAYVEGKRTTVNPALPHIRTRKITTNALVNDGQTLVIRGSTTEDIVRVKDKVPVLGDLPLVGRVFRSESTTKQRKVLIIFVTPSLVDSAGNRIHSDNEPAREQK